MLERGSRRSRQEEEQASRERQDAGGDKTVISASRSGMRRNPPRTTRTFRLDDRRTSEVVNVATANTRYSARERKKFEFRRQQAAGQQFQKRNHLDDR